MHLTKLQKQVVGLDQSDLCEFQQGNRVFQLHKEILEPFTRLQQDAKDAGFNLAIVSAYRDFSRQKSIWNAKAGGKKEIVDSSGYPLNCDQLSDNEKLYAILRWSAIPGTSRHHWGCDVDVYDADQISHNDVQLIPSEVESGGPCAAMHEWLSDHISNNESYGFFRPYNKDFGGVAPEKWHLSYLPVSRQYITHLTPEFMLEFWQESEILLFEELKTNILDIWERYIHPRYEDQPEWVASV